MGLPTDEKLLPEHYMCEECQPEDHAETLAALGRGEKIWVDRQRAYEAEVKRLKNLKKRGRDRRSGGAKGRQSKGKADLLSDAVSTSPAPPASVTSGTKRKFEEEESFQVPSAPDESAVLTSSAPAPESASTSAPAPVPAPVPTPAPVEEEIKESSPPAKRENKRRKSNAPTAVETLDVQDVDTALVDIDQLPKERQNPATALSKMISEHARERAKEG